MRYLLLTFHVLFFLLHDAVTQSLAEVPPCGQTCISNAVALAPSLGCTSGNTTCLCASSDWLNGIRDCSNESCPSDTDLNLISDYVQVFCNTTTNLFSTSSSAASASTIATISDISTEALETVIASDGSTITSTIGSKSEFFPASTTAIKSGTSSSDGDPSSVSTTTNAEGSIRTVFVTQTPAPSGTSAPRHSSLSTGAKGGIGVGVTVGVLAIVAIGLVLEFRRRSRNRTRNRHGTEVMGAENSSFGGSHDKPELDGGITWVAGREKPELMTQANAHELEDGGVSATLSGPWSVEGRHELPDRDIQQSHESGSEA